MTMGTPIFTCTLLFTLYTVKSFTLSYNTPSSLLSAYHDRHRRIDFLRLHSLIPHSDVVSEPKAELLALKEKDRQDIIRIQSAHSPEKAEQMLRQLDDPSVKAYNNCLKAWKKARNSERALKLLEEMEELGIANTISYTTVISTLAQDGTKSAAQHASEIMDKNMLSSDSTVEPNTQTFNSVIHAWVQCGNLKRAEQVLRLLEDNNRFPIRPDVVSYSTVMGGWAKSNDKNAVDHVKIMFQRMEDAYKRGNVDCKPNVFSYVTLINAYCRSKSEKGAMAAENLIYQLYDEYKKGNKELQPSAQLVTSVIQCWANSGARDAGVRAESLLRWLVARSMEHPDANMRPNEFTFSSTITAYGKSRRIGKATLARGILDEMLTLRKAGQLDVPPNAHCYTAVINSCAYCENDPVDKKAALRIAVDTYRELRESTYATANPISYATFLTALRNLIPSSPARSRAAREVLSNAADTGCVSDLVLQRVETILTPSELRQLFPSAVTADGKVDRSLVPVEWSRYVD